MVISFKELFYFQKLLSKHTRIQLKLIKEKTTTKQSHKSKRTRPDEFNFIKRRNNIFIKVCCVI